MFNFTTKDERLIREMIKDLPKERIKSVTLSWTRFEGGDTLEGHYCHLLPNIAVELYE